MTLGYVWYRGLLIAALIVSRIHEGYSASEEYSGFVGCLFSDNVCNADEFCIDDRLFGNCQKILEPKDYYKYYLDHYQLQTLQEEVASLIDEGFTWTSVYTQCVLGNILIAFRTDTAYDADFCAKNLALVVDDGGWQSPAETNVIEDELEKDTLRLLTKYFEDYYSEPAPREPVEPVDTVDVDYQADYPVSLTRGDEEFPDAYSLEEADYIDPYQKRADVDEFVNVHKYLKSHKRDPAYSQSLGPLGLLGNGYRTADYSDYDYPVLEEEVLPAYDDQVASTEYELPALLETLTPEELELLQDYITEYDTPTAESVPLLDYEAGSYEQEPAGAATMEESAEENAATGWDEQPLGADVEVHPLDAPVNEAIRAEEILAPDAENMEDTSEPEVLPPFMQMTQDDAKMIGDLLQERLSVSDLSSEQISRLTQYVDSMLTTLDELKAVDEQLILGEQEQEAEQEQAVEEAEMLEDGGLAGGDEYMVPAAEEDMAEAVKKEQNNFDALLNPAENSRWQVMVEQKKDPHFSGRELTPSGDDLPIDPHDHSFEDTMREVPTSAPKYEVLDANWAYLQVAPEATLPDAEGLVTELESLLDLSPNTLTDVSVHDGEIDFRVSKNDKDLNASQVATLAKDHADNLKNITGFTITKSGIGHAQTKVSVEEVGHNGPKYFVLTFVLCGTVAGLVLAGIALYVVRRHSHSREKLAALAGTSTGADGGEASKDYQDLCRQRMQTKSSEKPEPLHVASAAGSASARVGSTGEASVRSPSSRSSTSSWSEEPVQSNMDISTGHIVLSYMEDHLKNKDRLEQEWASLESYEAEPNAVTTATDPANQRRNRYTDILPYDHSRVVLSNTTNIAGSDYINASTITDHDPRNPAYIATQGPLPHTVADFWQMVWEQGSVVIVNLTKLTEAGTAMCHRYWPEEGSDLYHIYEVHLVSEHIWCPEYLVRSFYLKNLQTNETRTVTQFHFLAWPDLGIPDAGMTGMKALLDFRRKVNKSYRGRSCPIVVHCSDGSGRTGAYCLIDMVLNRMSKGAKEIDIAATLEHIRDQRMSMVKTKEQFEFSLAAVAEEVHAILKALPQ